MSDLVGLSGGKDSTAMVSTRSPLTSACGLMILAAVGRRLER